MPRTSCIPAAYCLPEGELTLSPRNADVCGGSYCTSMLSLSARVWIRTINFGARGHSDLISSASVVDRM